MSTPLFAHYCKPTKTNPGYVLITPNNRPTGGEMFTIFHRSLVPQRGTSDKAEAQSIARAYNAKPWNF